MQTSWLDDAEIGEVASATDHALAGLQHMLAVEALVLKNRAEKLNAALALKYGSPTEPGTHLVADRHGLEVKVTVPKLVDWDQEKLAEISAKIAESGDDPAEYIKTKHEVEERRFASWPEQIKALFRSARTVRTGKPRYEFRPAAPMRKSA